jgi:acetyl esterase/lipase
VRVRRCSPPLSRTDLAPAHAQRILRPASVTVAHERLSRVGFYGEWLTPRGARRHTAILLFGGSEGGLAGHLYLTASMLAGHGYPVLALAYFREPGLPRSLERIPLEYFQRALQWMGQRRDVEPQQIVTFGISRGGELSLLLSSTFPNLVHGAIEYVGANVVIGGVGAVGQPSWIYQGSDFRSRSRSIGSTAPCSLSAVAPTSFLPVSTYRYPARPPRPRPPRRVSRLSARR